MHLHKNGDRDHNILSELLNELLKFLRLITSISNSFTILQVFSKYILVLYRTIKRFDWSNFCRKWFQF